MINLHDIRYVRLGTRDLEGAARYAVSILGLEDAGLSNGCRYFRSDTRDHTLVYCDGDPADHTVGFELTDGAELDAVAAEIEAHRLPVRHGTREECELRRVAQLVHFTDPSGNGIDLVVKPQDCNRPFVASRDAGVTGFSHIGLRTTDATRDERFWTRVCNARVSDRIGAAPLLRIDAVHHRIALFPSTHAGVQHINHQVGSIDDIMRAWYFLRENNVRIVFGPGRHPTSSAIFLYYEGPDGMVYEYSTGVRSIDDEAGHRPRQFPFAPSSFCIWGSRPDIPEFRDS